MRREGELRMDGRSRIAGRRRSVPLALVLSGALILAAPAVTGAHAKPSGAGRHGHRIGLTLDVRRAARGHARAAAVPHCGIYVGYATSNNPVRVTTTDIQINDIGT